MSESGPQVMQGPITVSSALLIVRNEGLPALMSRISSMNYQTQSQIPLEYITSLDSEEDKIIAYKLCVLVYYATKGTEIPKELQLRAALASVTDQILLLLLALASGRHISWPFFYF
jgi:hypothetical protein